MKTSKLLFRYERDGVDAHGSPQIRVLTRGGSLLFATLTRMEGSEVLGMDPAWVVRRIDWFDSQPGRDPTFRQALTLVDLRELADLIEHLNATETA